MNGLMASLPRRPKGLIQREAIDLPTTAPPLYSTQAWPSGGWKFQNPNFKLQGNAMATVERMADRREVGGARHRPTGGESRYVQVSSIGSDQIRPWNGGMGRAEGAAADGA